MNEKLRPNAIAFFEGKKASIAKVYSNTHISIYKDAMPVQMKVTLAGSGNGLNSLHENIREEFKDCPVSIDMNERSRAIEVQLINDDDAVNTFLGNLATKNPGVSISSPDEAIKKSFRELIRNSGGVYDRHFKMIGFRKTKKNPEFLDTAIYMHTKKQIEKMIDLLTAIGLKPWTPSGTLTVRVLLDGKTDYATLAKKEYKEYFIEKDGGTVSVAKSTKQKKKETPSSTKGPQPTVQQPSTKENPTIQALGILFTQLSPGEQEEFLSRYVPKASLPFDKEAVLTILEPFMEWLKK